MTNIPESLVHGMYNAPADVIEAFKTRCTEQGVDFACFTWDGPEIAPFEFTTDPSVVVVLDATLGSLGGTLEFANAWAADGQTGGGWRSDLLRSDPDNLRLLEGSAPFVPWKLRWRRIRLDVNTGKKPKDLRDPQKSPGIVGIFLAAQHPVRIANTDCKELFDYWLPGLQCTSPNLEPWQRVPYVGFSHDYHQFDLGAGMCDYASSSLAIPVFWED